MDAFDHFTVLINAEEQYSIWPTELDVPPGWHETGTRGGRDACLRYIDEVWTDIRPKSLRDALGV